MHLSKDFKPPGVSDNKRFQSTAQMAMADTASRYSGLESPGQRAKTLRERKINNTRTNVHLGFEQNQNYETAMQAGNNYDRTFKGKVAGGDGIDKLTPHEMKMKLSSSNWEFGDVKRDWSRASTLQDPTGPQFLSYRGVLNEDVRDNIKSSNLYFGPDQKLYATTARESMILKTNDIDYAGDFARAKAMKKALTSSSLCLATDGVPGDTSNYVSVAQSTMVYDKDAAMAARGKMNAEMKKDLRAQHFKVGYGGTTYETAEKERQRTLADSVQRRRAEILANSDTNEDPDLTILKQNRENSKALKQTLLCTSFVIGDDPEYM